MHKTTSDSMAEWIGKADWGDVPTWLASIIAIAALIFAGLQLRNAVKQNTLTERQQEITAQQQEDAARPVVIAQIEENPDKWTFLDFCVKNYGTSPAYNVTVTFEEYPDLSPRMRGYEFWKVRFLNQTIPVLAPGQMLRTFADAGALREECQPLRGSGRGTIEYYSKSKEKIAEQFHIDMDFLRGSERMTSEGLDDISKTLKDIKKRMK